MSSVTPRLPVLHVCSVLSVQLLPSLPMPSVTSLPMLLLCVICIVPSQQRDQLNVHVQVPTELLSTFTNKVQLPPGWLEEVRTPCCTALLLN